MTGFDFDGIDFIVQFQKQIDFVSGLVAPKIQRRALSMVVEGFGCFGDDVVFKE